jgi:hypothetical protein
MRQFLHNHAFARPLEIDLEVKRLSIHKLYPFLGKDSSKSNATAWILFPFFPLLSRQALLGILLQLGHSFLQEYAIPSGAESHVVQGLKS